MPEHRVTTRINGNTLILQGDSLPIESNAAVSSSSSSTAKNEIIYLLVTVSDESAETGSAIRNAGAKVISLVDRGVYLCRWNSGDDLQLLKRVRGVQFVDIYPHSVKVAADLTTHVQLQSQRLAQSQKESSSEGTEQVGNTPSLSVSTSASNNAPSAVGPAAGSSRMAVKVHIHFHKGVNQKEVERTATEAVSRLVTTGEAMHVFSGMIVTTIEPKSLGEIAAIDAVRVIERAPNPSEENHFATEALGACGPSLVENGYPYTGDGERISVGDTGLDIGGGNDLNDMSTMHPCFTPPAAGYQFFCMICAQPQKSCFKDTSGHGTHVCGSAVGASRDPSTMGPGRNGYIKGVAPQAVLLFTLLKQDGVWFPGPMIDIYEKTAIEPLPIFSQSWGGEHDGTQEKTGYTVDVENLDSRIKQDNTLVCWSAGNDAEKKPIGGNVGWYASGKNVLTVGACLSPVSTQVAKHPTTGDMAYKSSPSAPPGNLFVMGAFSCWNTSSGRQKPDIVAPGVCILSARSRDIHVTPTIDAPGKSNDDKYCFKTGTSMATPLVAGCAAILNEGLKKTDKSYTQQSGVLLKALLVNGAVPLQPDAPFIKGNNRPWGFGRVNLQGSLKHLASGASPSTYAYGTYTYNNSGGGSELSWDVSVGGPTESAVTGETTLPSLKVTLAYADDGHEKLVFSAYLTLTEMRTNNVWFGNTKEWVPKKSAEDSTKLKTFADLENNVQQIISTGLQEGLYRIRVTFLPRPLSATQTVPYGVAWLLSEDATIQ